VTEVAEGIYIISEAKGIIIIEMTVAALVIPELMGRIIAERIYNERGDRDHDYY